MYPAPTCAAVVRKARPVLQSDEDKFIALLETQRSFALREVRLASHCALALSLALIVCVCVCVCSMLKSRQSECATERLCFFSLFNSFFDLLSLIYIYIILYIYIFSLLVLSVVLLKLN